MVEVSCPKSAGNIWWILVASHQEDPLATTQLLLFYPSQ